MAPLALAAVVIVVSGTGCADRSEEAPVAVRAPDDEAGSRTPARAPRPEDVSSLYPAAAALMTEAADRVDADPENTEAWFDLGRVYQANRQLALAEQAYRAALELDPQHADAWHLLAMVLEHVGRIDDAAEAMRRSIAADPDQVAPYWVLGLWRLDDGELDEAEPLFAEALRRRPRDAAATVGLARLRLQQDRPLAAIELLTAYLEINPYDQNARFILGTAQREAGNTELAERELSASAQGGIVYRDDPVRAAMYEFTRDAAHDALAAEELVQAGRLDEARSKLEAAMAADPDHPTMPVALHRLLRAEGRLDEAIAVLEDAAGLRDMSRYHYHLAWALRERAAGLEGVERTAELERALEQARLALTMPPDSGVEHGIQGLVLQDLGRDEEAAEELWQAAFTTPNEPIWARQAADALVTVKRWSEAATCLRHLVKLDANDTRSLYLLGAALANDGRPAEAEPVLERAVELAPDNATFAEALASVRRARAGDPDAPPDGRP